MRRLGPVLLLFFLSPLVGEFLLGDFGLAQLFFLVGLAPMYGAGAVLVREVGRRRAGWPTMLLLAGAYAVLEEGLLTESLFNPDYAGEHLLAGSFVPGLGIGAMWTVYVISLHVVWSISAPIAVVEGLAGKRARTPWLGRTGLGVVSGLFALGCAFTAATGLAGGDHFVVPWPRLAGAAVGVVLLAVAALRIGRPRPGGQIPRLAGESAPSGGKFPAESGSSVTSAARFVPSGRTPGPLLVGVAGLVAASAFEVVARHLPISGWVQAALILALVLGSATLVHRWARRPGWSVPHVAALGCGAVLTYAWQSFWQTPVVAPGPVPDHVSDAVLAVLALALVCWTAAVARRTPAAPAHGATAPAVASVSTSGSASLP